MDVKSPPWISDVLGFPGAGYRRQVEEVALGLIERGQGQIKRGTSQTGGGTAGPRLPTTRAGGLSRAFGDMGREMLKSP
jgi:hypothetical protein